MTDKPTNLAAALAAVQAELPAIAKGEQATVPTKSGGSYSYRYADLADVSAVILPMLGKVGLAWTTLPTMTDGRFVLHYELLHVSGDSLHGEYPLPDRGTPQEIGSAITYARRYALCAVTGVAPAADDDDGAAATHRAQREQPGPWSEEQPVPFRAERRPDPEQVRQNILTNARKAIADADVAELEQIGARVTRLTSTGAISGDDATALRRLINDRASVLDSIAGQPAVSPVDRTAEPAPEVDGRQPMEAEWPQPAKPGGGSEP